MNKAFISIQDRVKGFSGKTEFPFRAVLDFRPLVKIWEQALSEVEPLRNAINDQLEKEFRKAPELLQPIEDLSILEKHEELVKTLMMLAFPAASWEHDYAAAFPPFQKESFYETPLYKRIMSANGGIWGAQSNLDPDSVAYGKILRAYSYIAKKFYGINIRLDYPLVTTFNDPKTGLARYFKPEIITNFTDVESIGEPRALSGPEKQQLCQNPFDLGLWMKLVPPENFVFYGFGIIKCIDITDQEIISGLKRDLIEKESLVSNTRFNALQDKLRTLLRLPRIVMGLVAYHGDEVFLLNSGCEMTNKSIATGSFRYKTADFTGSIYDCKNACSMVAIEDLVSLPNQTPVEKGLIEKGVRSIVVSPLYYQDKLIGGISITSPNPGELNELQLIKLNEVLPLFSMAVNRTMQELNSDIQTIIKENFTVIHPSVEWRFEKAALKLLEDRNRNPNAQIEEIVFHDVVPLYGISDIRRSSDIRNEAIQADLIEQLKLTQQCLIVANRKNPLPILEELIYRIGKKINWITSGLSTETESAIIDFLRRDIEPICEYLSELGDDIKQAVDMYKAELDPSLGFVYKKRKLFEESLKAISDAIGQYIDEQEAVAQKMYPHYFEKHKTDGVDHSIYIGASLVEDGKYSLLYLKNLRLWQLIMMCGAARIAENLKQTIPVPLETTHLVLVQNTPLSIRFRPDEKQFDPDGSYNVRYEIIKKRIDKAMIRNRAERLTQPGKIAIVYSHPKEVWEYRDAIDYLQASGYLNDDLEELELEDLQGVQGMKALRVSVNISSPAEQKTAVILEAMQASL